MASCTYIATTMCTGEGGAGPWALSLVSTPALGAAGGGPSVNWLVFVQPLGTTMQRDFIK